MWNFLEKIRQKPDPQKKLIALISASVITLIIILIWLPTVFNEKEKEEKIVEEVKDPVSEVTPISNLSDQVGEIKGIWNEITSQFKNSTTTLEIESNVQ